ncbi:hypothetical protein GcC1_014035, partial [Golovinomyces cichoracearum]
EKLHPTAVEYCKKTWLVWKEKLILFWVHQTAHFDNTVTSRNESSHATIKKYIGNSRGDFKAFFEKIKLFWKDQHSKVRATIDQEKRGKIPSNGPPLTDCNCWINSAYDLPCYHQLYKIQQNPGLSRLSDINNHWYYDRNIDPQS